jgi:type I restriction enzyme M protein
MIDASAIYTPQRAQNVMTENDIRKVFELFNNYADVLEHVKIVKIDDIRKKSYTLAINNYVEKKEQNIISPAEVRKQYLEAFGEMIEAEKSKRKLLIEGGYVNE